MAVLQVSYGEPHIFGAEAPNRPVVTLLLAYSSGSPTDVKVVKKKSYEPILTYFHRGKTGSW